MKTVIKNTVKQQAVKPTVKTPRKAKVVVAKAPRAKSTKAKTVKRKPIVRTTAQFATLRNKGYSSMRIQKLWGITPGSAAAFMANATRKHLLVVK